MEAAFCRAERVTLTGSVDAGGQQVLVGVGGGVEALDHQAGRERVLITTSPDTPAFSAICLIGASMARNTMAAPVASSPVREVTASAYSAFSAA